jgi:cytochrome c oxidase subunit IV
LAYRRLNLDLLIPDLVFDRLIGEKNMANNHEHHITPFNVYFKVFAALIVLTILTVVGHMAHLGVLAAPVAFVIATAKALLVMGYFMHLKHENNLNKITFAAGFFFLALLFVIAALDIATRIAEKSTL